MAMPMKTKTLEFVFDDVTMTLTEDDVEQIIEQLTAKWGETPPDGDQMSSDFADACMARLKASAEFDKRPTPLLTDCPHCGMDHRWVTRERGAPTPGEGDASLCIGCGQFNIFEAGKLRKPNRRERRHLERDTLARTMVSTWRKTRGTVQ